MCAIHHGRSGRAGLKEDHSLGNDRLAACCGVAGHIYCRWARVRIRRIASSTRGEGTETVGGARDVAHHPQSRNSFEAGKRSMISTRRLCFFFPAREKIVVNFDLISRGVRARGSVGDWENTYRIIAIRAAIHGCGTEARGCGSGGCGGYTWNPGKKVKRREDMKTLLDPQRSTARW